MLANHHPAAEACPDCLPLAGHLPSEFPQTRLRLDFSGVVMSPRLRLLVSGLLEPHAEERLSAQQALDILHGNLKPPAVHAQHKGDSGGASDNMPLQCSPGGSIQVLRRGPNWEITLPKMSYRAGQC